MTNLEFKLVDPLLHPDDVLLEGCLIILEASDLLLKPDIFCSLVRVMSLDLFLHSVKLICECLLGITLLHCKDTF